MFFQIQGLMEITSQQLNCTPKVANILNFPSPSPKNSAAYCYSTSKTAVHCKFVSNVGLTVSLENLSFSLDLKGPNVIFMS